MPLHVEPAVSFATLVLIGGGEFSFGETREIDRLLLERMPRDRRRVAFLPTASGSAEYAGHLGGYLRELDPGVEVVNVPVYRGRDNRRTKNLDAIRGAGLVYFGGGVTNTLLDTLLDSPAASAVQEAAESGAVVAAIGASASCFGTFARDMRGGSALPAFGWLRATVVESGFDPANDIALRRLMSLPGVELGLGVPAKTALVIDRQGAAEIAGEGQVAAFRKPH